MLNENLKDKYKKDQEKFYTGRFNDFGLIIQADGWTSDSMATYYYDQVVKILLQNLKLDNKLSVLDIGSGHGFFYKYLREKYLLDDLNYSGIEINSESYKQAKLMNPEAEYFNGDFLDYKFPQLNYDYTVFIGTFSIFASMSAKDVYGIVEANLNKAFSFSNYGTVLLISKFVLPESSVALLYETASGISEFYDLNTTIFGDYVALTLYKKKFVLDSYRDFQLPSDK